MFGLEIGAIVLIGVIVVAVAAIVAVGYAYFSKSSSSANDVHQNKPKENSADRLKRIQKEQAQKQQDLQKEADLKWKEANTKESTKEKTIERTKLVTIDDDADDAEHLQFWMEGVNRRPAAEKETEAKKTLKKENKPVVAERGPITPGQYPSANKKTTIKPACTLIFSKDYRYLDKQSRTSNRHLTHK